LIENEKGARVTDAASSDSIQVGDLVAGKYRVDRVLGEGGMGIVVAATHQQLDEKVALKFLRPSVASNPEIVQRFVREARAAVKIRSEHVARVLDVGALESGTPYMVMEYLDGQDLAQTLAGRGPLPVSETVTYVLQACEAVAEAHSLGTVHRDLKPANLFLARRPNGRPVVKVLDFGISKVASTGENAALTNASAMMGSPSYMSPEQMVAAGSVDVRADVWALGVVLYELLTGTLPFVAETMPELVGMILQSAYPPVAALRPDVPPGLQATIDRCLQKDRTQRHRNVAELAAGLVPFGPPRSDLSLERISHVLGLRSAPEQTVSASMSPAALAAGQTFSPVVSSKTGPGRRRLLLLVPAPLLIIAACAGVFFVWTRSTRPASSAASAATAALTPAPPILNAVAAPPPAAALTASTAASASLAALAVPTVLEPSPTHAPSSAPAHPRPAATAPPSASAVQPASPACHTVSYFDSEGNRHFRQECR
jgi:eukaryotic-like serine/threonine-protein kinase